MLQHNPAALEAPRHTPRKSAPLPPPHPRPERPLWLNVVAAQRQRIGEWWGQRGRAERQSHGRAHRQAGHSGEGRRRDVGGLLPLWPLVQFAPRAFDIDCIVHASTRARFVADHTHAPCTHAVADCTCAREGAASPTPPPAAGGRIGLALQYPHVPTVQAELPGFRDFRGGATIRRARGYSPEWSAREALAGGEMSECSACGVPNAWVTGLRGLRGEAKKGTPASRKVTKPLSFWRIREGEEKDILPAHLSLTLLYTYLSLAGS